MTIHEGLLRWRQRLTGHGLTAPVIGDEPPLRSELFSAVQMEEHGRRLAESHGLMPGHPPDRLLARLTENETLLVSVCRRLMVAVTAHRRIAPAGEWLLDNF